MTVKVRRLNVLRVLISAGALFFLFWKVVNPDETLGALRHADLRHLLAAFLLYIFSLILRAYRWFLLLRGLELRVTFGRLVHLYFVGQFFSSFLPTQFGGDVMRALELTEDTESSAAVGTVLLDRMTGLLVLLLMGLVALPVVAAQMDPWLIWLLVGVSGAGLVGGALVLEGRLLRLATGWLPPNLSLAGQGPLAQIYAAVTGCGWNAVMGALAVSVGFNLINILINWLCGQAVDVGANIGYFFIVTPLLSVSGMIPSIGGWGVREAVSTAVFAPIGADADVAAALAISLGGIALATGLLGGLIYGIERLASLKGRRQSPEPQQDDHQLE
jgi:uncharacterized membrane protein YbhN (UPF0104 family)